MEVGAAAAVCVTTFGRKGCHGPVKAIEASDVAHQCQYREHTALKCSHRVMDVLGYVDLVLTSDIHRDSHCSTLSTTIDGAISFDVQVQRPDRRGWTPSNLCASRLQDESSDQVGMLQRSSNKYREAQWKRAAGDGGTHCSV